MVKFQVYPEKASGWGLEPEGVQYRWRLISANGKITADSGEAYASDNNARKAVRRLIRIIESNFESKGFGEGFILIETVNAKGKVTHEAAG